jgi:antitoxin (DNA-binding transcriptional repressor) of toxin-antitoxin stability system
MSRKEKKLSITEVARNLSDIINRVAYRGEDFLLTRGNKVVAELRPAPKVLTLKELPALMKRLPALSPQELSALEDEIAAERAFSSAHGGFDPWES